MGDVLKVALRHFISGAVGAAAGWATTKTGISFGPDCLDAVVLTATVGVYGGANHLIKYVQHQMFGSPR